MLAERHPSPSLPSFHTNQVSNQSLEAQGKRLTRQLRRREATLLELCQRIELSDRIIEQQNAILAAHAVVPTGNLKAALAQRARLPPLGLPRRPAAEAGAKGASVDGSLSTTFTKDNLLMAAVAPRVSRARPSPEPPEASSSDDEAADPPVPAPAPAADRHDAAVDEDDRPMPADWTVSPPLLVGYPQLTPRHTCGQVQNTTLLYTHTQ